MSNCSYQNAYFNTNYNNYQKSNDKILLINPETITQSYAKHYHQVESPCGGTAVVSNDPRLSSAFHNGQVLTLDTPPVTGGVRLKDVYTLPSLKNYGRQYNTYKDIKAGQIVYYIDESIQKPYFSPVFSNESIDVDDVYIDPMGSFRPVYKRMPIKHDNKEGYEGCLSSIEDTGEYREDLIALQMRKINRQKYSSRWF